MRKIMEKCEKMKKQIEEQWPQNKEKNLRKIDKNQKNPGQMRKKMNKKIFRKMSIK